MDSLLSSYAHPDEAKHPRRAASALRADQEAAWDAAMLTDIIGYIHRRSLDAVKRIKIRISHCE
jgi:hypothetical protein